MAHLGFASLLRMTANDPRLQSSGPPEQPRSAELCEEPSEEQQLWTHCTCQSLPAGPAAPLASPAGYRSSLRLSRSSFLAPGFCTPTFTHFTRPCCGSARWSLVTTVPGAPGPDGARKAPPGQVPELRTLLSQELGAVPGAFPQVPTGWRLHPFGSLPLLC